MNGRTLWQLLWLMPRRCLVALVRGYRFFLSPWLGQSCRFTPSCSAYTMQALQEHGALAGTALGTWRILRCQPWCQGGHDPVPPTLGLFTRLLPPSRSNSFDKKNVS